MTSPRMERIDKSLIINGAMAFAQEKPSGTVALTTSMAYGHLDQWMARYTGTITTPTVEREDLGVGFKITERYNMKFSGNHSASSTFEFQQRIESIFAGDFAGKQCSIMMEVFTESLNTLTGSIAVPVASDDHSSMQTTTSLGAKVIGTLGSWQTVKFENFTVPSDAHKGLLVNFIASNPTVTGSTKLLKIRKVTLIIGSSAPSEFVWAGRNWADELHLCRIYYEKSHDLNTLITAVTTNGCVALRSASSTLTHAVFFKTTKRITPNTTFYNTNTGASGTAWDSSASASIALYAALNSTNGYVASGSGFTAGNQVLWNWVSNARL